MFNMALMKASQTLPNWARSHRGLILCILLLYFHSCGGAKTIDLTRSCRSVGTAATELKISDKERKSTITLMQSIITLFASPAFYSFTCRPLLLSPYPGSSVFACGFLAVVDVNYCVFASVHSAFSTFKEATPRK